MDLEKIKEKIFGSDNEDLKKQFNQDILTDQFMDKLDKINYNKDRDYTTLISLAEKIDHLKGWPKDPKLFWDIEAPFWHKRVDEESKNTIQNFIKKYQAGRTLNLGCGSYSYTEGVNLDISSEMLFWNKSKNKIQADAQHLPFKDNTFKTITAVLLVNYLKNIKSFAEDTYRVLKEKGNLIIILGSNLNELHKLTENKEFSMEKLIGHLRLAGFGVKEVKKGKLTLMKCSKF